jgi:osmotically-inducible protein OsmY
MSGCTTVIHKVKEDPITPDPTKTSLGTDLDDFQIETAVGVNIKKAHPLLESAHINVHAYNGVVLLTGEIPTDDVRGIAGDTARKFRGVRQVHNELQVQGSTTWISRSNDSWLSTKVKSKMIAYTDIPAGKIKVIAENGTVYLMGILPQDVAERAARVASATKGVRRVVKVFEYID